MNAIKWTLKEFDKNSAEHLAAESGLLPLTAALLTQRGIFTADEAARFLKPEADHTLGDPFLMADMEKAVKRIKKALADGERICIYGDYDVDGVTATVLLYKYLKSKGGGCGFFIPDRINDGYGLNSTALETLASDGYTLVVTVDTGVTALEEVEDAKKLGLDIIITDHHSCRPTLPDAVAVVNPQREDDAYPFKQLAGVGVAFKLICALEGDVQSIIDGYGDLVALGTVADVMPLVGENRYLVGEGLKNIAAQKNKGLAALMRCVGAIKYDKLVRNVNAGMLGFVLAPRLNAAGRIDQATISAKLLLSEDEAEADALATELCEINTRRREMETQIYEEAKKQLPAQAENPILICGSEGWHQGVIGIVASRISERHAKPCVLLSYENNTAKGSARSIKGFSIVEALSRCGDILTAYGGHELAAGLTLERGRVDELAQRLCEIGGETLPEKAVRELCLDLECGVDDINVAAIEEILSLEPFGQGNPQPLFLLKEATLFDVRSVGNGKHMKLTVGKGDAEEGGEPLTAMCFGMPFEKFEPRAGDVCDIAFTADLNAYGGTVSAQMLVKAIRPSQAGETPDTAAFREFYKLLKQKTPSGDYINLDEDKISNQSQSPLMLAVLEEFALIEYDRENKRVKLLPFKGKVDLARSVILNKQKTTRKGNDCGGG